MPVRTKGPAFRQKGFPTTASPTKARRSQASCLPGGPAKAHPKITNSKTYKSGMDYILYISIHTPKLGFQ